MKQLGLMGGTFDPIHLGHLRAAEEARVHFNLARVIFVPAGNPPHKNGVITPAAVRLEMTQAAIMNRGHFAVSDFEMQSPGKSYTVNTLEYFRSIYGAEWEIFFITGADAILEILTWHDVQRLMTMCKFIAVARPGYAQGGLQREIAKFPGEIQEKVLLLEVPGLHISSTEIRDKVKVGAAIDQFVPKKVEEIIKHYNLYKTQ